MGLDYIKQLVMRGQIDFSTKVLHLFEEETASQESIVSSIMNADRIYKRQRDEQGQSIDGYKYTILGRDYRGYLFYSVGKIRQDRLGRFYFVITAHDAD